MYDWSEVRTLAGEISRVIRYDCEKGKHYFDRGTCPYWIAKTFGWIGEGDETLRWLRMFADAIQSAECEEDAFKDVTRPDATFNELTRWIDESPYSNGYWADKAIEGGSEGFRQILSDGQRLFRESIWKQLMRFIGSEIAYRKQDAA